MAALAFGLTIAMAGCGSFAEPEPAPPSPSAPAPAPEPTEVVPALVPDGTAEENLPLFEQVVAAVWASESQVQGAAYIDALTAAGFDRSAMAVTKDESTVGRPAETIQFSVAWGTEECLVGQVGPSTGSPVTRVMPQLADGRCLIGELRPIDW